MAHIIFESTSSLAFSTQSIPRRMVSSTSRNLCLPSHYLESGARRTKSKVTFNRLRDLYFLILPFSLAVLFMMYEPTKAGFLQRCLVVMRATSQLFCLFCLPLLRENLRRLLIEATLAVQKEDVTTATLEEWIEEMKELSIGMVEMALNQVNVTLQPFPTCPLKTHNVHVPCGVSIFSSLGLKKGN